MPILTNISRAPYFDDYNEKDNYHRILFKPSVAVQVRELNQLQTILQNQIERFGDNVYKRGTIIDGCNFTFHSNLPYVKIDDTQTDGAPVNVSSFKGLFAKNANNVIAQIVETASGFESTDPNLNTLHLKYISSGASSNTPQFAAAQELTIYDPVLKISEADVEVKSSGFSNADNLVIMSAIEVSNTVGGDSYVNSIGQACTFITGEIITQDVTGAQAEIMEVNATANVETLILKVRPLASNLRLGNTVSWLLTDGYQFTSSETKITAKIQANIGKNAFGTIVTDATGGIKSIAILNGGVGYYIEPWITVAYSTPNTSSSINGLIDAVRVSSKNYLCNVTINDSTTAVGFGTGIAVSEGIIYQKGHFVRVSDQFIVVDKYSNSTNNVVGFDTKEEIITFRQDQNLVDNASGTLNERAPGADRLKLTPQLVSITKEEVEANTLFLPLIEYDLGKPSRQRKTTQFNSIAKELAQRTFEQSGNYVLDQFLISTEDIDDIGLNSLSFRVKADPGTAYVDGYRVQTNAPILADTIKGSKTATKPTSLAISYGNFIRVNEMAGFFNFAVGDKISLRDAAKDYISSSSASGGLSSNQFPVPSAAGTEIGTAKIRSMQIEQGLEGDSTAVYKVYLFDIRMNRGKNFKNVKSIFFDGSGDNNGVADIVLDGGKAVVYDAKSSTLLFTSGLKSLSSVNSISYLYRTTKDNLSVTTGGIVTVSVASSPGEYFDYTSILTSDEKKTLTLVPLANTQATVNAAGEVLVTAGGNTIANLVGVSTNFRTSFKVGDYIKVANSGGDFEIKRINKIANATHLTVDSTFANNLGTANVVLFFPRFVPINIGADARRSANVTANTTLRIGIGNTLSTSVPVALSYNARKSTQSVAKTVTRNALVKIDPTVNDGGSTGPWCLGLPDIIRLKTVYEGTTTTFNGSSGTVIDGTDFITFTNDYLSDGEAVVYRTATSNAAVGGLTNNQIYYVKDANSTGIKLSSTSTGSAINISPTGSDTTQYILSVSKNDKIVTQNYYIDHNQRKDYYDVGFLYKTATYTVPSNKLLLAEFDVLSTTQNGIKTITSYPINDAVSLANNTAAIHTLEVPELVHDNGEYFDLRDTLDFRPYSTNTAIRTTNVNQAPFNPLEPSSDTRFDIELDKKFPVPNSICDITAEKYLSRIDSVILLSNTAVKIVTGQFDENPKPPVIPKEGLLLNHLIIPPYPSLPKKLSSSTLEYTNKNIVNVNNIKKRQNDHTISVPISPEGLPTIQSKTYKMEDIASLERRIADLEYYTSLSFTEDRVNNLQLTSSVDTATNRFKFGFFVDNFTTSDFAEIRDPAYYAQIYGYELNPKKKQMKLEYSFNLRDAETARCIRGKKLMLPSREIPLITQKKATEATTLKVATTETTFTTTGTEITNTTTNIKEITTQEWQLLTQQQEYQEIVSTERQVKKMVTKQRTVTKERQIMSTINSPGSTGHKTFAWKYSSGGDITAGVLAYNGPSWTFKGSKSGGAIYSGYTGAINSPNWTTSNPGITGYYDGADRGVGVYGNKLGNNSAPWLERNDGNGWYKATNATSTGYNWFFLYYKYGAVAQGAPAPQFRFNSTSAYDVDQMTFTSSEEYTELETYQEEVTVTEGTTTYQPMQQTIYQVNPTTNTTVKQEVLVDTTIEESTTSLTKSLFNPKPAALMRMDQLFNLPGQLNSPTIDLLAYIQDDINS
jgi:hypothetical protein